MFDNKDLKYLQDMEARMLEQSAQITERLIAESEARTAQITEKLIAESEARTAQITEKLIAESEAHVLEQTARNTRVLLESYVEPKFNLLAENQQTIIDMITPKSEIEELRGEIDLLKMVIRTMSADIAELKQAQ